MNTKQIFAAAALSVIAASSFAGTDSTGNFFDFSTNANTDRAVVVVGLQSQPARAEFQDFAVVNTGLTRAEVRASADPMLAQARSEWFEATVAGSTRSRQEVRAELAQARSAQAGE